MIALTLIEKFNSKLSNIMKIPELRERIFFTLMMFLVARVGTLIPAPGVDVDRLSAMTAQNDILIRYSALYQLVNSN